MRRPKVAKQVNQRRIQVFFFCTLNLLLIRTTYQSSIYWCQLDKLVRNARIPVATTDVNKTRHRPSIWVRSELSDFRDFHSAALSVQLLYSSPMELCCREPDQPIPLRGCRDSRELHRVLLFSLIFNSGHFLSPVFAAFGATDGSHIKCLREGVSFVLLADVVSDNLQPGDARQ